MSERTEHCQWCNGRGFVTTCDCGCNRISSCEWCKGTGRTRWIESPRKDEANARARDGLTFEYRELDQR